MSKLYRIDDQDPTEGSLLVFHCPGCGYSHPVNINRSRHPVWEWNGSMEAPTFSPSLLVNAGTPQQCHLFIRDGRLEYLADCHHALAGQTVPMEGGD